MRLAYGRSIDSVIKGIGRDDREEFYYEKLRTAKQPAPLQFIMSSGDVAAVASTKHLLLNPQQVYDTAAQIIGAPSQALAKNLYGEVFEVSQYGGIKVGVQIDGGDLLTRTAVRVAAFARVVMCFNPLSWLGVGGLSRFVNPGNYERVLRIQKLNELFPRLQAAIHNAKSQLPDLERKVNQARITPLNISQARILNGSMGLAYGLGKTSINRVFDRYTDEDQTQYGLAMAQSWEAEHGEHRKTPDGQTDRVPQSLSTISGATLLIDDIKTAEAKACKWLQGQQSDLAKELLKGKIP